jgi:hypothetical protein
MLPLDEIGTTTIVSLNGIAQGDRNVEAIKEMLDICLLSTVENERIVLECSRDRLTMMKAVIVIGRKANMSTKKSAHHLRLRHISLFSLHLEYHFTQRIRHRCPNIYPTKKRKNV